VPGSTPASLLSLHEAGYRELTTLLGGGLVLDAGCGLGFGTETLARPDRKLLGVDYVADVAAQAGRRIKHDGPGAVCSDVIRLGLRTGSVDWACSSHVIEHFDTPGRHVAELARVLRRSGTAIFLTPNAPWDYENPFHLVHFTERSFGSLLNEHFSTVHVAGLEASARAAADFAARRAKADKILAIADPFHLRHRLPHSWYVAAYARVLPITYRVLARRGADGHHDGRHDGHHSAGHGGHRPEHDGHDDAHGEAVVTPEDYTFTEKVLDTTPVLIGIATGPRRREGRGSS
jgi:SAM-dependent methyltransferase